MAVDATDKTVLTSYLVSFFLDCLFFGIFSVTYSITIWLLVFNEQRRRFQNRKLDLAQAGLLSVMFLLAFTFLVLDIVVNVHAFAGDNGDLNLAKDVLLVNNSASLWGPKLGILVTQTILADGYLIYRVFVVWSRSWYIAGVMTVFLLCDAVFGYTMVHYEINLSLDDGSWTSTSATISQIMTILFFASSLVTNIVSTVMIAGRIIKSKRNVRDIRVLPSSGACSQVTVLLDIIVQSAAIYSCALAVVLITMFAATKEPLVVLGILPPLAGAVFSLVIIRTRLADATKTGALEVDFRAGSQRYPNRPSGGSLAIHVTSETHSYDETK